MAWPAAGALAGCCEVIAIALPQSTASVDKCVGNPLGDTPNPRNGAAWLRLLQFCAEENLCESTTCT
jgi:hypothetical protein